MRLKARHFKLLAALALILAPIAFWALFKPVRLLVPGLAGVTCQDSRVCTDAPERAGEAAALVEEAVMFVRQVAGNVESRPRAVFCSSDRCAAFFGLGRSSAKTTGPFGTVYGPHAWKDYYVRHELLHHLQNERLGMYRFHRGPEWFIEGMAYALSGDPRAILSEPFQSYRHQFNVWYGNVDRNRLWQEAAKL